MHWDSSDFSNLVDERESASASDIRAPGTSASRGSRWFSALVQPVGVAAGMSGTWFVTEKNSLGLWLWLVANLLLTVLSVRHKLWGMALMYVVYMGMTVKGLVLWLK